jgi:hypothetical protein
MTSVNKAFVKKLHTSFPGRTVNRNAFGKDVRPGTAISSSLCLVRSDRTLPINCLSLQRVSARLQKDTGTSEQLPTGHIFVIRRQNARHFSSIQQSPLCRRTVHCLRRLLAKIQSSIPFQFMRDLWWTKWSLFMPV